MKVKIGDTVYDSKDDPIMIILTEQDKQNIANMLPEATKYCQYNDEMISIDRIMEWMENRDDNS